MKSAFSLFFSCAVGVAALLACNARSTSATADVHASQDPTRCADCHTPEFDETTRPPHPNARPDSCGVCHTQTSWHPWRVDHPWYVLTGAHLKAAQDEALEGKENQVKCFWCHRGDPRTFKNTKTDCISCHADDRATSTFPGHANFQTSCEDCHSTDAWKPARRPPATTTVEPGKDIVDAGAPSAHGTALPQAPKIKKPKAQPTALRASTASATAPPPIPTPVQTTTTPPDITSGASRRH